MRKQQAIWLKEHTEQATLPTMANIDPTSGVIKFFDLLKSKQALAAGKVIDIGAGKGRNSIYAATLGYEVWALEYIEPAIIVARGVAERVGVANKVHFMLAEIDKPWPVDDNYFDVAIDSFASIDIETKHGRELCRDEMYRTLKPGGYGLVNVCSSEDEWERELIKKHPGLELNSTIWPQNGKFQKDYDEPELRQFYAEFEIVDLQAISKPASKLGREGIATNWWLVVRKK